MSVRNRPYFVILSVLGILASGCATSKQGSPMSAPAAKLPPVIAQKIFVAAGGTRVEVVDFEDGTAFVRAKNIGGSFENKAVRCKVKREPRPSTPSIIRIYYTTQWHGSEIYLLSRVDSHGGYRWQLNLHEPRYRSLQLSAAPSAAPALDAFELERTHRAQKRSGALKFQRYERRWWIKSLEQDLDQYLQRLRQSCGHRPRLEVLWSKVEDATIRQVGSTDVLRSCFAPIDYVQQLCGSGLEEVKRWVGQLSSIRCDLEGEFRMEVKGKTLLLSDRVRSNQRRYIDAIWKLKASPKDDLGSLVTRAWTDVCAQGERRIVIGPKTPTYSVHRPFLAYGRPPRFIDHGRTLGPLYYPKERIFDCRSFFDPRHVVFTGGKVTPDSCVAANRKKKHCTLRCGQRKKQLPLLDTAAKEAILREAKYQQRPLHRIAHALARDRRGRYYYVDRGPGRQGRGDFRVYIGRRGRLQRQQMVDVVSDSEGQIFETKRGKLRLIVSKSKGLWIAKGRPRQLSLVPVEKNLPMIFGELGVYWGKRLGTPCDDF